jgi:hypothetical protein
MPRLHVTLRLLLGQTGQFCGSLHQLLPQPRGVVNSCTFCERECTLSGSAIEAPTALEQKLSDQGGNPREVHHRWTFGCNAHYLGEEPEDAAI